MTDQRNQPRFTSWMLTVCATLFVAGVVGAVAMFAEGARQGERLDALVVGQQSIKDLLEERTSSINARITALTDNHDARIGGNTAELQRLDDRLRELEIAAARASVPTSAR